MLSFVIFPGNSRKDFERPLLGGTVADCMAAAIRAAGFEAVYAPESWPAGLSGTVVAVLAPALLLEPEDWQALASCAGPARLMGAGRILAVTVPADCGPAASAADATGFEDITVLPEHSLLADSAATLYQCQEALRRKINEALLSQDVILVDPATTYIAPTARIEPGCQILPGCHIYGETEIGGGSVIGPNCFLHSARLGREVRVNASQIYESSVGSGTTVGPFAYIRPGCQVGENVRIGDFVELKNSVLGRGTKVSHLTYLGDADFGENINVGCGVVTVNYDGAKKHRTTVGDGSFIGCNVNLVAPVTVEKGAYLAAGTTITQQVEADSLAIGRARQENKPGWAARWRQINGKK